MIFVPGGTELSTESQNGLSSRSAAKSMAFDSTPAIFFGSRFTTTTTSLPTNSFGSLSTAVFLFIFLHWLSDVKKILAWYKYINIAGTATLTCYLIPYFYYSLRTLSGIVLPEFLLTGFIGLTKSLIYSLIIVGICWGLKQIKIQLKI